MSIALSSYRIISRALSPLWPLYLKRRLAAEKEDPERLTERYGQASLPRPQGVLIWMHAASVGESVMLLPLMNALLDDDKTLSILVTTGTVTSAQMMAAKLPSLSQGRAVHQYAPADSPKYVTRFLEHWRPDLAVWAESEIWPNLVLETKARGVPMALVNARLSAKSLRGWQKRKSMARKLFACFDTILPADARTASGLSRILGQDIAVIGNLKFAAPALTADIAKLAGYRAVIGDRPVWCAASTHDGEEEIILAAHRDILKSRPDALLILVPRHPERGAALTRLIAAEHFIVTGSGFPEDISDETQILLVSALGKLGLAYRLARVSLIAGSLLPGLSGHNPLEPARLSSAILTGAHVESFADIFKTLTEAGGAKTVSDAQSLAEAVLQLWEAAPICKAQTEAAGKVAASQDQVLDQVQGALKALIARS